MRNQIELKTSFFNLRIKHILNTYIAQKYTVTSYTNQNLKGVV